MALSTLHPPSVSIFYTVGKVQILFKAFVPCAVVHDEVTALHESKQVASDRDHCQFLDLETEERHAAQYHHHHILVLACDAAATTLDGDGVHPVGMVASDASTTTTHTKSVLPRYHE